MLLQQVIYITGRLNIRSVHTCSSSQGEKNQTSSTSLVCVNAIVWTGQSGQGVHDKTLSISQLLSSKPTGKESLVLCVIIYMGSDEMSTLHFGNKVHIPSGTVIINRAVSKQQTISNDLVAQTPTCENNMRHASTCVHMHDMRMYM